MTKYSFPLIALMMTAVLIYSCKNDDEVDLTKNCLVANFYDAIDDVDTSFVDLRNLIVEFIKDTIVVKVEMVNIPPKITINQDAVPLNALNFQYEVIFDVDSSDARSSGDLSLTISKFKFESGEVNTDILSSSQKNVWEHESATRLKVISTLSDVSISGNTLIFRVPISLSERLNDISCSTNVVCLTYYTTGIKSYQDQIPG